MTSRSYQRRQEDAKRKAREDRLRWEMSEEGRAARAAEAIGYALERIFAPKLAELEVKAAIARGEF